MTVRYRLSTSFIRQQAGLTLVELIIAMGLGIAIIGAAIQFSLSSHQLSEITAENNYLTQNARLAQAMIARDLRMGGYRSLGQGNLPAPFLSEACGSSSACTEDDADNRGNDSIAVVYQPEGDDLSSGRDCTGVQATPGQLIANQYYIALNNGVNSLMCRSFDVVIAATTTATARAGGAVALLDGIDAMQLLYGVPSATAGVTQFVNANDVTDWSAVQAVRLAFLVSDGLNQGSWSKQLRSYTLLDADSKSYDDTVIRHVYTSTIELNNTFSQ